MSAGDISVKSCNHFSRATLMILFCRECALCHYKSKEETRKIMEIKKEKIPLASSFWRVIAPVTGIIPLHHVSWHCSIKWASLFPNLSCASICSQDVIYSNVLER